MKHLLMDPNFPDLVAEWAAQDPDTDLCSIRGSTDDAVDYFGIDTDPLLDALARLEIELTRAW